MTIYSGTLNAFITDNYRTIADIKEHKNTVSQLFYTSSNEMLDWTKVGTAEVTLTFDDESKIVAGMINSIDKQIQDTYAEAESKINLLKEKKQSLLAITMES
jgi:hypothetical protein